MSTAKVSRFVLTSAAIVVLAGGGLLAWGNTDVFGRDEFCNGALVSAEASAVLEGSGRLTQMSVHEGKDPYGFSCTVQRTRKLMGGSQPRMEIELSYDKADFALGSRLWKDPSANSYFAGDATGAVSETQAWVLLPPDCAEVVPSGVAQGNVPVVEINVKDGRGPREALAEAAMRTARHVADGLDCVAADAFDGAVRLQGPGSPEPMDEANTCGITGFQLPDSAVVKGQAEPGNERYTGDHPKTWACDLYLAGPGKPQITFTVSEDPDLVGLVKLDEALHASDDRRVLRCGAGDLYAGMFFNDAYRDLMLDQSEGMYEKAHGDLFVSLLEALGRKCREGSG